jgi:hypothetical protein
MIPIFLICLYVWTWLKKGYWPVDVLLVLCGLFVLLLTWIATFKLELDSGMLLYRTLFGGTKGIALADIRKAKIEIGTKDSFGPMFRLEIFRHERAAKPIVVNMKVFSLKDLNYLLDVLGPAFQGKRRFSVFAGR